MTSRPSSDASLLDLLRAGGRALGAFPGLAAALYLVQLALSVAAAWLVAVPLDLAFGDRPVFARAMDGDLPSLVTCLSSEPGLAAALAMIALGAVLLYALLSWFLTAGTLAVLAERPAGRGDLARCFGAAGAGHIGRFARLWAWSLVPYAVVLAALAVGALLLLPRVPQHLLGPGSAALTAVLHLGPALLLHWIAAAAVDYARIDLVRHPARSPRRALLAAFALVLRRPVCLAHTLTYGLVFAALTAGYAALGLSLPGLPLVAVVALRQLVSAARFAAHIALLGGQVSLAPSSDPP
jgi:hypothetical protein